MTAVRPDLLDAILAAARRRVADARAEVPVRVLERRAAARAPDGASFTAALARPDAVNIIAECKRRSPARGVLRAAYDPAALARAYERAGAAAVSVLTEPAFFDGALDHLDAVRAAVRLPLLRKDFILDEYQVLEARAAGADAILLIAAALDAAALTRLLVCAGDLGLAVLVEVHDAAELERAAAAGAGIIGVNNRNLRTLQVDVAASRTLASRLPPGVVAVSESGLHGPGDVAALRALGYRAFLVGEHLMTHPAPESALAALIRAGGDRAASLR